MSAYCLFLNCLPTCLPVLICFLPAAAALPRYFCLPTCLPLAAEADALSPHLPSHSSPHFSGFFSELLELCLWCFCLKRVSQLLSGVNVGLTEREVHIPFLRTSPATGFARSQRADSCSWGCEVTERMLQNAWGSPTLSKQTMQVLKMPPFTCHCVSSTRGCSS